MDDILKIADDPSLLIDELPNLNKTEETKIVNNKIEEENINISTIEDVLDNKSDLSNDIIHSDISDDVIDENLSLEETINTEDNIETEETITEEHLEDISEEETYNDEMLEDIILEDNIEEEILEDISAQESLEETLSEDIIEDIEEVKEEIPEKDAEEIQETVQETKKKGVLDKYGENLTNKEYVTNPAIARDLEIEKTILTLLTPDKSAILVGKAGIGKTAIVEGIGYLIQHNKVPKAIGGYEIIKVNTSSLTGKYTTEDGTEELRINILLNELQNAKDTILFIDEIHTLVIESRNSGIDFLNAMKPALSRGDIKVIGATTLDEYNQYLIKDKAFLRRFEKIEVEEPNAETTVKILMGSYPRIERKTGVKFGYPEYIIESIMTFIVDMTSEYKRIYELGSRYPDNALALLSKAFSYAKFDDSEYVKFKHIYKAIMNCQSVYSDVIKKESEVFKEKFKDHLERENVDLNDY